MAPVTELPKWVRGTLVYGPCIAAILWASAMAVPGVSAIVPMHMDQLIVGMLVLLALAQLSERYFILRRLVSTANVTAEATQEALEIARGAIRASDFFGDPIKDSKPEARIANAKLICISGIHLVTTTKHLWLTLKAKLQDGAAVRILLLDPDDNSAVTAAAYRFDRYQDAASLRDDINSTLRNYQNLMAQVPGGNLEIRLLRVMPPFGIWLIDQDEKNAEAWVEVYSFREDEPTFRIRPQADPKWYSFFERQFHGMWSHARVWSPSVPVHR